MATCSHKTCMGQEPRGLEAGSMSPPNFPPSASDSLPAPFCISDSALALKHFRQACLRAQTPWAFPENHSPRNHFCLGEQHHPASHFHPTKDPAGPRRPQACNAAGIPVIRERSRSCGRKNRAQRATISLPAQGGNPSPPSTATSTKPPPFPTDLQRHLCFSQQQKQTGGELSQAESRVKLEGPYLPRPGPAEHREQLPCLF